MAKKYSVNIENDEVVSVAVDGVQYDRPELIPDAKDRAKIYALIAKSLGEHPEAEFDREFDKEFEKDIQEMEASSNKFLPVLVSIFGLIGAIMLAVAIFSGLGARRQMAKEQSASGTVVDLVVRPSQVNDRQNNSTPAVYQDFYYPVVAFNLPDGTQKTVQLSEGSWPPAYEKGEAVTVLYDPDRPLNARIKSTSSDVLLWILPGITGTLGIVFLIAAAGVWWFFQPAKPAAPSESPTETITQTTNQ